MVSFFCVISTLLCFCFNLFATFGFDPNFRFLFGLYDGPEARLRLVRVVAGSLAFVSASVSRLTCLSKEKQILARHLEPGRGSFEVCM